MRYDQLDSSGASVSFRGVAKSYGKVDALIDFNLEVESGEFVTLLGPSGSGKTTALNVLAGFTDASAGDIRINDQSILNLPPEHRNIGMVFQNYSLFPHMTVAENIAFPLHLRRVNRSEIARRTKNCLEMIQLPEIADRMPKELSGGERQRVAFARAVVFEPPVLLMDEPLGALDLKLREAMQLEIKRYHQQLGCSIVFVTHDQGEALALSDRVAVMGDGRIAQIGSPSAVYNEPNSKYVARFIGRTNFLKIECEGSSTVHLIEAGVSFDLPSGRNDWGEGHNMVSLRPERLFRCDAGSTGPRISGIVTDVLFLGDTVQYTISIGANTPLLFQENCGSGTAISSAGEPIELSFNVLDLKPIADTLP
jgi:putative spermidine/putrescine transport system ATP-binding protein